MPQRYRSARNSAFHTQRGRCYYCEFSMWLTDRAGFAAAYGLTLRQASRLQATAEHLLAQQDGGKHGKNVVSACHHCNQSRHKHRSESAPHAERFRARVQLRGSRGRWHPADLFKALGRPAR